MALNPNAAGAMNGRLGADPELKYLPSGTAVANFSLAVNGTRRDDQGHYEAHWFDCEAYGQPAEFLANYAGKGDRIAIAYSPRQHTWNDQEGRKRSKVIFTAAAVSIVSKKADGQTQQGGSAAPTAKPAAKPAPAPPPPEPAPEEFQDPFADEV